MQPDQTSDQPILEVEGLMKHFPIRSGFLQRITGWVKAVNGVDFRIPQGHTLGLVGESGCGKSTVARMILRLLTPDAGRILFRGRDISRIDERQMKPLRRQVQIIFQDPYGSLNPRMTAGESVAEGLRTLGQSSGRQRSERLAELFTMVGMSPEYADRYPHEFSGGQRQRIGIARALSVDPSLIVCDEPISALDVSIQAQIINLLKDLQQRLGLSYLFISHDLNVVGYLCSRVAVMYNGYIMEHGPAEVLFEDPRHPYTQKLLAAIPEPDPTRRKKAPAPAEEIDAEPFALPRGCVFQDHCPDTDEQCRRDAPVFEQVGPDHFVRCRKVSRLQQ